MQQNIAFYNNGKRTSYQTAEDGLGDTVKPRLIEADADLERVLVIDDRDTPLTLADARIARAIRDNSARLVISDPVQAFLGADVDMNRANEDVYKRQHGRCFGRKARRRSMVQLHQEEAAARTRKLKTQSADPLRFALSRFRLDCASITPNNT